jgi:anti-sigma factor RsiW
MDMTDAGFPLAGGRLDYVDNRSVAVLVYRRRQHLIDVFIWPGAQASLVPPSLALSERGYQVMHWARGGMTFWAISDLNATELKSFAANFVGSK